MHYILSSGSNRSISTSPGVRENSSALNLYWQGCSSSSTPTSKRLTTYCLLDKGKFLTPLSDHQMCPLSILKTIYPIFSFYFPTLCAFYTRLFSSTNYPGLSFLYDSQHVFPIFCIFMIFTLSPCHQTIPRSISLSPNQK